MTSRELIDLAAHWLESIGCDVSVMDTSESPDLVYFSAPDGTDYSLEIQRRP